MTNPTDTYYTCDKKKKQIDALLSKNASYQAQNTCVKNSSSRKKEINRYCNREFLLPIKKIDENFYASIKLQND
jgi:hypothetical protein